MAKPSSHPKFKALKKKWDQILVESGFEDIETARGDLRQSSSGVYSRYGCRDSISQEVRTEFFVLLGQHVMSTRFKIKIERLIMESFASGLKQVEIQQKLASLGIRKHRVTISRVIHRWLKKWNLK